MIFQTNDRKLFVRGRICCLLCPPCKSHTISSDDLGVLRTSRTSLLVDACVQSASQLQFKEKYFYIKSGVPLPAAWQYCHAMPLLIGRLLYSKLHPNRTNCNFYMLTICREVASRGRVERSRREVASRGRVERSRRLSRGRCQAFYWISFY